MLYATLRVALLGLSVIVLRLLPWPVLLLILLGFLVPLALLTNRTHRTRIAGARVLVTGASSGLGRQLALQAAARGAEQVILVSRGAERLQAVADEIGPRALVRPCDITDPAAVQALADGLAADGIVPDIVVNNAGAGAWQHIEEGSLQDLTDQMACPYLGAAWLTRALAPAMLARGSGHVLNVTSLASLGGFRAAVGYGTARWAVRGFSQNLRADLHDAGIGVTLLNAAEIGDTAYFAADNAGAASHARIPWLFQLPLVRLLSKDSARTASEGLDGIESGTHEVLSPWYMAAPTKLMVDVFPELFHALLRQGESGRR